MPKTVQLQNLLIFLKRDLTHPFHFYTFFPNVKKYIGKEKGLYTCNKEKKTA
jgi:hypothetical protein